VFSWSSFDDCVCLTVDSWVPRGMWWFEAYSCTFCVILLSRGRKYYRPLQSNVNTDWLFVPPYRNVNMVPTLRHQIGVLDFSFQFPSSLLVFIYLHFISASIIREWGRSGELREIPDADKSLARPAFRCILFDGENISFDASLILYINSTNIPPIMIINRMCETHNILSL
jgi:hypothetical protein